MICSLLILSVVAVRVWPDGRKGWEGTSCPCSAPKLCEPIATPRVKEDVYAFHTTGNASWRHYNWSLISTICVFGTVDPELLCHAHSLGVRLTLGAGGPPTGQWNDTKTVASWVAKGVDRVQAAHADGLNLDIEIRQDDPIQIASLATLSKAMADAIHKVQPGSHVTFDTPSEGETGSMQAKCGEMYGRDYNYKALAEAVDFFVVMDYDSNDAHHAIQSSMGYQPRLPHPYIYHTRSDAKSACVEAGYDRLCTKSELHGYTHCAYGWTSDWEGYWMATATKGCGLAGYNPPANETYHGPAGAYCCGKTTGPCPTCYFANSALPVVKNGVACYSKLGVPASKLVLAFPWYGYDYTCRDGQTTVCDVTAAAHISLTKAKKLLANATPPGRIWQANASTPHFFYEGLDGHRHRVDYDDSQSLRLKYSFAKSVGARGTGMWTASSLDYEGDPEMGKQFWSDLKLF